MRRPAGSACRRSCCGSWSRWPAARGPALGATVFEVEVADVARAVSRATEGGAEVSEHETRRALDDLMGPESIIPPGPPRLDVLPCDGLAVPERYRVMFSGDPGLVEPPGQG